MFKQTAAEHRDALASSVTTGEFVHPDPVFHTIITVDVAGSGSRSDRKTLRMRQDLRQIMIGVLARQGIAWESVYHDDTGDGLRVLLPPGHPAMRVLGPFVNELEAALRAHSMDKAETARLRLRAVVHHGLAYFDGGVWAGKALVLAARLLDSDPLRKALKANPDATFALIVSEPIYNDVIINEYGPPASAFEPVQVSVKETQAHAWVYVPGAKLQSPYHLRSASSRRRLLGLDLHKAITIAGLLLTVVLWIGIGLLTPEVRCLVGLGACAKTNSSPPGARYETTGGVTHTWSDYRSGGGTAGPDIPKGASVLVSCRTMGLKLANGNAWWYRIASPDWSDHFYASADPFYNNGQSTGPLSDTPFVDESVPDCGG